MEGPMMAVMAETEEKRANNTQRPESKENKRRPAL